MRTELERSAIEVGKRDVKPTISSHVAGVQMGNGTGTTRRQKGLHPRGLMATATAERSTGINPRARNSVTPNSPNLPPP